MTEHNLDECFRDQQDFSRTVLAKNGIDLDNISHKELAELTIRFSFCIMVELGEVMGEDQANLDWKFHREPTGNFRPAEAIKELVDCQKYLWNLFGLWGITTPEQFAKAFNQKSLVVLQRWDDEKENLADNNHS